MLGIATTTMGTWDWWSRQALLDEKQVSRLKTTEPLELFARTANFAVSFSKISCFIPHLTSQPKP